MLSFQLNPLSTSDVTDAIAAALTASYQTNSPFSRCSSNLNYAHHWQWFFIWGWSVKPLVRTKVHSLKLARCIHSFIHSFIHSWCQSESTPASVVVSVTIDVTHPHTHTHTHTHTHSPSKSWCHCFLCITRQLNCDLLIMSLTNSSSSPATASWFLLCWFLKRTRLYFSTAWFRCHHLCFLKLCQPLDFILLAP